MESRTSVLMDFGDSERMRAEGGLAALLTQKRRVLNPQRRRWRPIGMGPRPLSGNEHRIFSPGPPVTKLPAVLHFLSHRDPSCDRVCDVRGPRIDKVRPG